MKIFSSFNPTNPNIRIDKNGTIITQNSRVSALSVSRSRSDDPKSSSRNIQPGYVGRDTLNMPVLMASEVVDTKLYEASNDPSKKYYLPRYELATEMVSNNEQFRIELSRVSDEATPAGILKLFLNKTIATELKESAQNAEELDHDLIIDLRYMVKDFDKHLKFQEISIHESSAEAVLNIPNALEFNQVFLALTEISFDATLIVKRQIKTALPLHIPVPIDQLNPQRHKPFLVLNAIEEKNGFNQIHLGIRNRHLYKAPFFAPSPSLPAAGFKKDAARTWVDIYSNENKRIAGFCALSDPKDLENIWLAHPKNRPFTKSIYAVLQDRKTKNKYISQKISLDKIESNSPLFKKVDKIFSREQYFTFPKETNEYIYRKAGTSTNQEGGYIPHYVKWGNINHVYLQDELNREQILFFPDEFRLARTNGDIKLPWATVIFQGEQFDNIEALIGYRIDKYIDYDRIQNAAKKIISKLDDVPEKGLNLLQYEARPFQLVYKLKLPKETGHSIRSTALLSLNQIKDTLPPLSIDDFTTTFDTLSSTTQTRETLRGQVEVDIKGFSIPSIPVSIRFAEVGNEAFRLEQIKLGNNYQFTLYNTIESAITVSGLSLILQGKDQYYKKKINEHQAAKSIESGTFITFSISGSEEFPIDTNSEITLNWDTISVDINKDSIYDLIIDPTVPTNYVETIKVELKADSFEEYPIIKAIEVDIRSNANGRISSTELTKEEKEKSVPIYSPIKAIVLGESTGRYEYKVTTITATDKLETEEWKSDTGTLHIVSADVPLPPPTEEETPEVEELDIQGNSLDDTSEMVEDTSP